MQSSITAPAAGYAYTIVFGSPSTPISLVIDATISGCDAMPSSVNHNTVVSLDTTHGIGTFSGGQYFTLSFDASTCSLCRDTTSIETGNIDWEQASSGQGNENSLQSQLNELANIANSISDTGTNGVVVTRSDIDTAINEGYVFTVTFSGNYVPGNVPQLVVGGTNTLGNGISTNDGAITVQIATTQEGKRPGFKLTYNLSLIHI